MNSRPIHIEEVKIKRFENSEERSLVDKVAVEAPLEIRLKRKKDPMSKAVAVTMRTPGQDAELALGFLFTEAIIRHHEQVIQASLKEENVIEIVVTDDTVIDLKNADRNFYTTSSCGVCGKASIEAIKVSPSHHQPEHFTVSSQEVLALQDKVIGAQSTFDITGGIHASSLFRDQELISIYEDVGRHNALDKLIGHHFMNNRLPLNRHVLLLSGRASFELVQKAAMAGIPIIVAIGAPSSLAIELADEFGLTLIGFLKKDRFNIYSASDRITLR